MDPWLIIGWIVLWVMLGLIIRAGVAVGLRLALWVYATSRDSARHRRSRNVAPAAGQVWQQRGKHIYVTAVYENGNVGIRTSPPGSMVGASWADSPEAWQKRSRDRHFWLERP